MILPVVWRAGHEIILYCEKKKKPKFIILNKLLGLLITEQPDTEQQSLAGLGRRPRAYRTFTGDSTVMLERTLKHCTLIFSKLFHVKGRSSGHSPTRRPSTFLGPFLRLKFHTAPTFWHRCVSVCFPDPQALF